MYTPRLKDDLIKRMYTLCQRLEIPMTQVINGTIEQTLSRAEECLIQEGKEQTLALLGIESAQTEQPAALAAG